MENPPAKYFRLGVGLKSRLKHAYIVECTGFKKDDNGNVTEVYCTYFPESKSGSDTSGIKVKGTMHWVDANTAETAEIRLYDRLFKVENPATEEGDFKDYINTDSLSTISKAYIEPALKDATLADRFQFLRIGYFALDTDSTADHIVFNKTVGLKDSWSKEQKKG
jgi:glutaminyl-tRNA synthetase